MVNKVKQYSDLQLSQPMPGCPEHLSRHLLHQGDYKLRDHNTSKTDVHVFVFTDLLLITKITQRKAEKVKVMMIHTCYKLYFYFFYKCIFFSKYDLIMETVSLIMNNSEGQSILL